VHWTPRHHTAILTHHQYPTAGSGAGAGQLSHWPHPGGGASSSGISTTAARSSPARADTGGTVGAVVVVVVIGAAAVASCCGFVATATLRGGSPVVTALPAARGALDEHCLVGMDASDLSALAGVRAGTVGATLRTRRQKTELQPLETRTSGGSTAYLKVEKPRFLFLEGATDATVAPVAAAASLPDASATRADAPAACAASSADRPVAGASAPTTGACSSAASAALGDGGGGFHLSGGARPPSLSSSSSSDNDDEFSRVAGRESPCCSRSRYSSLCCSLRSRRRMLLSFRRVAHSCSHRCAAQVAARARGVGGSDCEASTATLR
jgi:hypothetical protein